MYHANIRGFTIVELTLAMTFLALLMLAIAGVTIQISSIYVKGLTLREVNQSGQQISTDLRSALSQSVNDVINVGDETGGRLCIDNTVYAWNYAESLGETIGVLNVREDAFESEATNVRFMKFKNLSGINYCQIGEDGFYPTVPAHATELLGGGNKNIALHEASVVPNTVEGDSSQTVYVVSILVGTKDIGELLDNDGADACLETREIDSDNCAINRFKFTARTGNKEEEER